MKIKSLLAILLVLCLNMTIPMVVGAVESDVNVEFIQGTDPIGPVDPDNPANPLTPSVPGTGEAGPLQLNYVTPLTFDKYEISNVKQVYSSTTLKPFVQVSDLRGSGAGWRLTATASAFSKGATDDSLPGAIITLNNGFAISENPAAQASTPVSAVVLKADGTTAANVAIAGEDTGMGTWVHRWFPPLPADTINSNVTLTVPSGVATIGAHSATITWNLIDAI